MQNRHTTSAFTIVELIVIIVVISILVGISVVSYGAWRYRSADEAVKYDLSLGTSALRSYKNFKNNYPPNLSATEFAASNEVALRFSTNSDRSPVYENLTPEQNAQLFINSCNANIVAPNTSCTFAGSNVHVSGTAGSNVVWHGPSIDENEIVLQCGSNCDAAAAAMRQQFIDQNGTFPISVPNHQVELPSPTLVSRGNASRFCLQASSGRYTDIVYHTTSEKAALTSGPCPNDPELHYP